MNVLLVAPQPFYTLRGTPIAVRVLAEEIARLGNTVDLLTYWEGEDVDIPGVRIIRAWKVPGIRNIPIGFSVKKLLADASLSFSFLRRASGGRYDIIHAVEEGVFFALLFRWVHRAKVIYDMDSSLAQQMSRHFKSVKVLHSWYSTMENWAIRKSDRIIAVCEDLAVLARTQTDAANVFVLSDIVPPEATMEPSEDRLKDLVEPDEKLAMYVGNLESYQGVDLLVGAASELPSDVRLKILIIGGSSDDINRYQREIDTRGLQDRILLVGPRPLRQLMANLMQADILLSPRSAGNNTPLKLYCYMSAGKPIVATNIASHTQVLTDELAILVPPEARPISNALAMLCADPALRETLGRSAKVEADSRYTLRAFRHALENAYSGLQSKS
jgi:glycosyltransferase involved in cell wall biosynthesis